MDSILSKRFLYWIFYCKPLREFIFKCCCLHNYIDTKWRYMKIIKLLITYLYVFNNVDFLQIKDYITYNLLFVESPYY